jgi:hypothetical protein
MGRDHRAERPVMTCNCTRTQMCGRCLYERTGARVIAGDVPTGPLIVPGTRTLFDIAADTLTAS